MEKDIEVEVGQVIASSEELRLREDEEEELFLRLSYFFPDFLEKVRTMSSSFSKNNSERKYSNTEGTFHLLWSPRDEDSEVEAYLANHFNDSSS